MARTKLMRIRIELADEIANVAKSQNISFVEASRIVSQKIKRIKIGRVKF